MKISNLATVPVEQQRPMTSRTFDYSSFSQEEGDAIALNHFAQHLGEVRWASLVTSAKTGTIPTKEYFRDLCGALLEVEGRPVEAFIRAFLSHLPEAGSFFVQVEEIQVSASEAV